MITRMGLLASVTAAAVLSAGAAQAQTVDDPEVGEIVVTAQLRSERLQEVPISAQVVTAAELAEENVTTLEDLAKNAPSIYIIGTAGRSGVIAMRGVASGNSPAFDQSVSVFTDGVYHGQTRVTAGSFLDLERVEVLRGPQSTFFGNNAIAGALSLVSAKPTEDTTGWARAYYGRFDRYAVEGAIGGAIGPDLSARAAVTFNGVGGWLKDINTGEPAPHEDNMAGRLTFRYAPSDEFDVTLKLDGSINRNHAGYILQSVNCVPGQTRLQCINGFSSRRYAATPGQKLELDTYEGVLTANRQIAGHTLTSITAYQGNRYLLRLDVDATAADDLSSGIPSKYHQFSQEFRVLSPTGGAIEYIAGVYYQADRQKYEAATIYSYLSPTVRANPAFAALAPYLPLGVSQSYVQDQDTLSAFASLTWNATDRFSLTAAFRGSLVWKSFDYDLHYGPGADYQVGQIPAALAPVANRLGLGVTSTLSGKRRDEGLMPSLRAEYEVTDDAMIYASFSRAFKAGGFNYGESSGILARMPFAPEWVNAYELGLKSNWFDRRLLLNVALFRSEYKNLQTSQSIVDPVTGGIISQVRNAARSVSKGVEVESRLLVGGGLTLNGSVSYLKSRYLDYVFSPALDLTGQPTGFAPKWSGSVGATYTYNLANDGRITLDATGRFSTKRFLNPIAAQYGLAPGFFRIDGRLTYQTPDRRWSFDLIAENLNNERIYETLNTRARTPANTSYTFQLNEPRNVAAQVRYNW